MSFGAPAVCAHVVGMLVPRPCGAPAAGACVRCKQDVCKGHLSTGGKCRTCAGDGVAPAAVVSLPADLTFDPNVLEAFEVARSDDPDNAWSDLT